MHTTACTQPASRTARAMRRLVEIQEAAATLVIERGYDGFTMDELAERVGVSRGDRVGQGGADLVGC